MVSALVLVARWWAAGEGVGCAVGARVLDLRGSGALGVIWLGVWWSWDGWEIVGE